MISLLLAAMSSNDIFKKFTMDSISQLAATKASDQRRIRAKLEDQYPCLAEYWEEIMPKKNDIMLVKCHDNVALVVTTTPVMEVLFFQHHEGEFLPHLKLLHRYPFALPAHQCDIGGTKFVLSGATVMCPGLTSKGGIVAPNVPVGAPVQVRIEGKQHAVAVGFATMSSDDIKKLGKGLCIDNAHHMGDGLWNLHVLPKPV